LRRRITRPRLVRGIPALVRVAWDEAVEVATDALEREAWRRAVEGFDEPGEVVGYVKKYSDRC
jgi:hypothetical protein